MTTIKYYDKNEVLTMTEHVRRLAITKEWSVNKAMDFLLDNLHLKSVDVIDVGDLATKEYVDMAVIKVNCSR